MAILLKIASVRVSSIQIMQVRVQNKGKSVWKSRYVGDVSPANNAKVVARYCISRRKGTIQINKFLLVVAMHPYWKTGDTILLMLYQGTGGLFLFIDEMPSRRDQAASSG